MTKEDIRKRIEKYKEEKEKERREHPERFKPMHPYELFGIECGEGWKNLYQPIIDYIDDYNKDKGDEDKIKIYQIKEKFAGLRFYTNFYTDELMKMIRDAEEKSFHTCEICGKDIDNSIIENGWMYAECEECHKKGKKIRKMKV